MKKRTQILFCAIILFSEVAGAQSSILQHTWVFFRDKGTTTLQLSNPDVLGISKRALKRRAKSLPLNRLMDDLDLPVSETIIAQIKQTGVKIRTVSRWLNAVSVEATPEQLQTLKNLPMVTSSEQVTVMERPRLVSSSSTLLTSSLAKISGTQGLDYGPSATQLTNIKVVDLHAVGVRGVGVLIGMLDDGFNNYRTHEALKNINVVADSDFIHNINDVNRQPWEIAEQGNHGAGTLSEIGGFASGHLIGAAYGASFLLAKTEMDSSGNSDFHSEEDTYVAALEWMERLGVDITSSSLGYKEFQTPPFYTTSDMNGRTTKVAQAATIAARKGVLVVTAMGNEGYAMGSGNSFLYADSTIVSPADADSIIAVGATSSDGELATFSGTGPTADGRIKPEIVAQGMGIFWADGNSINSYDSNVGGTSCSTPLVAGAAALVLSAHPELTNMQVRKALLNTATPSQFRTSQDAVYPNNYYGYGFVNALAAALFYGPVFSNTPVVMRVDSFFSVTTNIIASSGLVFDSLSFYYRYGQSGQFFRKQLNPISNANEFTASIPRGTGNFIYGYFYAREQSGYVSRFPSNAPESLYSIGVNQIPTSYILYNNYPNPFNSGTTLSFNAPKIEHVELSVLNILGQHIATIFSGDTQSGRNSFLWDGIDEHGRHIATGVYFARLKAPSSVFSIKMLYLK
jgi:subtilisin family serine protease